MKPFTLSLRTRIQASQRADSLHCDQYLPLVQVISWFRLTRDAIRQQEGRAIPSLAFVHIPPHAARAYQETGRNPNLFPGINEELIGHQGDICDSDDKCKYSGADTAFMQTLVKTEGLMGVFSGHDHGVE